LLDDAILFGIFKINAVTHLITILFYVIARRSRWARGLKRGSAPTRFLVLRVLIPPGAWKFVCCECCVLSGRDLCVGLVTNQEDFYRLWCVWVWSWILDSEETLAHWGCCAAVKKIYCTLYPVILHAMNGAALFAAIHCWCRRALKLSTNCQVLGDIIHKGLHYYYYYYYYWQ